MSFITEIQQDIVSRSQELEKNLSKIDGLVNQLAGAPLVFTPITQPLTSMIKSIQKTGWDVHGIAMELTGGASPTENANDDLANLVTWWSYVRDSVANVLRNTITVTASGLTAFDKNNWDDGTDAPIKYKDYVQDQSDLFRTLGEDADIFIDALNQLEVFIENYWKGFWNGLVDILAGIGGVIGGGLLIAGLIIATPATWGASDVFGLTAAIAATVAAANLFQKGCDEMDKWSKTNAPDPPSPTCGSWPRPSA